MRLIKYFIFIASLFITIYVYADDPESTVFSCGEGEKVVFFLRGESDSEQYCSKSSSMNTITHLVTVGMKPDAGSL